MSEIRNQCNLLPGRIRLQNEVGLLYVNWDVKLRSLAGVLNTFCRCCSHDQHIWSWENCRSWRWCLCE